MFKYENLWALKLAKAMPWRVPRLTLLPVASMKFVLPVLISIAYLNSLKEVDTKFLKDFGKLFELVLI